MNTRPQPGRLFRRARDLTYEELADVFDSVQRLVYFEPLDGEWHPGLIGIAAEDFVGHIETVFREVGAEPPERCRETRVKAKGADNGDTFGTHEVDTTIVPSDPKTVDADHRRWCGDFEYDPTSVRFAVKPRERRRQ